jgi:hypothetical protein
VHANPLTWLTAPITLPLTLGANTSVGAGGGLLAGGATTVCTARNAVSQLADGARNLSGWWVTPTDQKTTAEQLDRLVVPELHGPYRDEIYAALCGVPEEEREPFLAAAQGVFHEQRCRYGVDVDCVLLLAALPAAQRAPFQGEAARSLLDCWPRRDEGVKALAGRSNEQLAGLLEASKLLRARYPHHGEEMTRTLATDTLPDWTELPEAVASLSEAWLTQPFLRHATLVPPKEWPELQQSVVRTIDALGGRKREALRGFEVTCKDPLRHWRELATSLEALKRAGAPDALLDSAVTSNPVTELVAVFEKLSPLSVPERSALILEGLQLGTWSKVYPRALLDASPEQISAWCTARKVLALPPGRVALTAELALLSRTVEELEAIAEVGPALELNTRDGTDALAWLATLPVGDWKRLGPLARRVGESLERWQTSWLTEMWKNAGAGQRSEMIALTERMKTASWASLATAFHLPDAGRAQVLELLDLLGPAPMRWTHVLSEPALREYLLQGETLEPAEHRERALHLLEVTRWHDHFPPVLSRLGGLASPDVGAVLARPNRSVLVSHLGILKVNLMEPEEARATARTLLELPDDLLFALRGRLQEHYQLPIAEFRARMETELQELRVILRGLNVDPLNPQNVHTERRNTATARSLEILRDAVKTPPRDEGLDAINAHLKALEKSPGFADSPMARKRAGATELQHALHALEGPTRPGQFTAIRINETFITCGLDFGGVGDIANQVWSAIAAHPDAKDRANMRHSFALALATCIEDSGSPVCSVGVTQRLVGVLQGYVDGIHLDTTAPGARLSELGRDFAEKHPDPDDQALAQFFKEALLEGRENYGAGTADRKKFEGDLLEYLRSDHDWKPATAG